MVLRFIVSELRRPGIGQCARSIEADEISAGRLRKRHNEAIGARDKKRRNDKLDRQQCTPLSDEALAIEQTAKWTEGG